MSPYQLLYQPRRCLCHLSEVCGIAEMEVTVACDQSRRSSSSREDNNFFSALGTMWCLPLPAWVISAIPLAGYWRCEWAQHPACGNQASCSGFVERLWPLSWRALSVSLGFISKILLPEVLACMFLCLNLWLCALYISLELVSPTTQCTINQVISV